jgi:hypothetical protein
MDKVEDCDLKEYSCVLRFIAKDFTSVANSQIMDSASQGFNNDKSFVASGGQRASRFNEKNQKAFSRKNNKNNRSVDEIRVQAWIHHSDTKGTDIFVINFMKSMDELDGVNHLLLQGRKAVEQNLISVLSVKQGSDASMMSRSRMNSRPKTKFGTTESPFKASKPTKKGEKGDQIDNEKVVSGLIQDTKVKINKFKKPKNIQRLFKLGVIITVLTLTVFICQFGLQIYYMNDADSQKDIRMNFAIMKNAISTLMAINLSQVTSGHQKMWQGDPVMLERIVG